MTIIYLSLGLLALATAIFALRRKRTNKSIRPTHGFEPSAEQRQAEELALDRIFQFFETKVQSEGYLKAGALPVIMARLRASHKPFSRMNVGCLFVGDDCLSVAEKRALGLNTRMKYPRKFIEYFEPDRLRSIEPKGELGGILLDGFHRASRQKQLDEFKSIGITRIRVSGTDRCRKSPKKTASFSIDCPPELPARGCDEGICMCYFEPIIRN